MKILCDVLEKNLQWFLSSGVMIPRDGLWGVAERIAVKKNNPALETILNSFPAWSEREYSCIIEQRRADCNFQAAWLFLESDRIFPGKGYASIGENILDFLYFRSGLLERSPSSPFFSTWNWSHIKRESAIYYDDEAWCILIQLRLAETFPELEKKYNMQFWAHALARKLYTALTDPEVRSQWRGNPADPHWGALAAMALAHGAEKETEKEYLQFCRNYFGSLVIPNVSEESYALLGAVNCALKLDKEIFLPFAGKYATNILSKLDPHTGLPPSEHKRETPAGKELADLIYTVNWAFMGLQEMGFLAGEKYSVPARKIRNFLIKIQDDSPLADFHGCWRGMYDTRTNSWGGGDLFEGGGNSIYTGWTNAPIALAFLGAIRNRSLFV